MTWRAFVRSYTENEILSVGSRHFGLALRIDVSRTRPLVDSPYLFEGSSGALARSCVRDKPGQSETKNEHCETNRDSFETERDRSRQIETELGQIRTERNNLRHRKDDPDSQPRGGISPQTPVVEHKGIVEPVAHFFFLTGARIIASAVRQIPCVFDQRLTEGIS